MSPDQRPPPNAYEVLLVHPTAPSELVATNYWALAGVLQRHREAGDDIDAALYFLTRCYEQLADPDRRSEYDRSTGCEQEPLTKRPVRMPRRSLVRKALRRPASPNVDLYEVMGVDPGVQPELLADAHRIMRDQYLRMRASKKRQALLTILGEAYRTLGDPEARRLYDERRRGSLNGAGPRPQAKARSKDVTASKAAPRSSKTTKPAHAPKIKQDTNGVSLGKRVSKSSVSLARGVGVVSSEIASAGALGVRSAAKAVGWAAGQSGAGIEKMRNRRSPSEAKPKPKPRSVVHPSPVPRSAPPSKADLAKVEDKFLGRVASSVKDSESHLAAESPVSPQDAP